MSSYDEQELKQNIVNILTEEQLRTMELEGTVPPNQDFFTEEDLEDMNLDCLRTKVLWTNPNPEYLFSAQTISLNSSDYDYIILIYNSGSVIIEKGESITLKDRGLGWVSVQNDTIRLMSRDFIYIDDVTYSVSKAEAVYWDSGLKLSQSENGALVPYKIIGLKKQPAMIYTGKELHESDCISIKDGVISAKEKETFLLTHPIGSYYITEETKSPIDKYGGGWLQIKGRFLLGAGANDANTNTTYGSLNASAINRTTIGETGGEVSHTLTTNEMPKHSHSMAAYGAGFDAKGSGKTANTDHTDSFNTGSTGGSGAHNNMPPYRVVYIWKRLS